jgi:uncharacterized protein (TIGR03083 family)
MESSRYLESLPADYGVLRAAAESAGLDAPVPSCPGWTVRDLVGHVAEVYLHKVAAMRLGEWPQPWPPDLSGERPLELLGRAYADLMAEFAARPPSAPSLTWYKPQQEVAFWIRRMAQETVIHRIDAELAARRPVTPVPDDIAVDGIDEVLRLFLAYGSSAWPEEFAAVAGGHLESGEGDDTVTVRAGGAAWTVRPGPDQVEVDDGPGGHVHAVVEAGPGAMLRWLWGRASDSEVTVSGDPEWSRYLRRLLVAATQ